MSSSFSSALVVQPNCNTISVDTCCHVCSSCNKKHHQLSIWHNRMNHPHQVVLHQVLLHLKIHTSPASTISFCEACQHGKLRQSSFPVAPQRTSHPFELIHSDVWGPAPFASTNGYKYYVSFVDDYTRYVWVYPLWSKSKVANIVQQFISLVERKFTTKVHCIQSDQGGEYRRLLPILQSLGIAFKHPCPYVHQQNGKVERKH